MAEYTLSTTALVSSGSKPSTTLRTWKDEGGVGGTVTKISDSSDSTYLRKRHVLGDESTRDVAHVERVGTVPRSPPGLKFRSR